MCPSVRRTNLVLSGQRLTSLVAAGVVSWLFPISFFVSVSWRFDRSASGHIDTAARSTRGDEVLNLMSLISRGENCDYSGAFISCSCHCRWISLKVWLKSLSVSLSVCLSLSRSFFLLLVQIVSFYRWSPSSNNCISIHISTTHLLPKSLRIPSSVSSWINSEQGHYILYSHIYLLSTHDSFWKWILWKSQKNL